MPPDSDVDADFDDQDQSEAFDETLTEGDANFGEPTNPDIRPDVLDTTYALGDGDTDGDTEALDADEISDAELESMTGDAEEDDLDDDDSDMGPLSQDDIKNFTADTDYVDEDQVDGVAAADPDEAEVIAMGDDNDLAKLASDTTLADLEPDDVSDEDLEDLGYKE